MCNNRVIRVLFFFFVIKLRIESTTEGNGEKGRSRENLFILSSGKSTPALVELSMMDEKRLRENIVPSYLRTIHRGCRSLETAGNDSNDGLASRIRSTIYEKHL